MASCVVTARKLFDPKLTKQARLGYQKAAWAPEFKQKNLYHTECIHFVSLLYAPSNGLVYCGTSSGDNQIFGTFDPDSKKFTDLEYQKLDICEPNDVKIHRSLIHDGEGNILLAMAGLMPTILPDALGGRIMRFKPKTGKLEVLGRPVPHDYIQTIAYDRARSLIYGFTYPMGHSFCFNMKTKETTYLSETISAHKACIDRDGNVWDISALRKQPLPHVSKQILDDMKLFTQPDFLMEVPQLYKYNPDDGYRYLPEPLPVFYGAPQQLANGMDVGDGGMYLATDKGGLYRVDKKTGEVEEIAFHIGGRLEGIDFDQERGLLFLAGGGGYNTHIFVVDVEKRRRISPFWPVADKKAGDRDIMVHALAIAKRKGKYLAYVGETDHPMRTAYLWECEITI